MQYIFLIFFLVPVLAKSWKSWLWISALAILLPGSILIFLPNTEANLVLEIAAAGSLVGAVAGTVIRAVSLYAKSRGRDRPRSFLIEVGSVLLFYLIINLIPFVEDMVYLVESRGPWACKELCDQEWWLSASTAEIESAIQNSGLDRTDPEGWTALHWAAKSASAENVVALLNAGANVNAQADTGSTPILVAADYGAYENVVILSQAGADLEVRDIIGRTPLYIAVRDAAPEEVAMIIEAGADVGALDGIRRSPLHIAAEQGGVENVEVLLAAGADVNHQDNFLMSPLLCAARGRATSGVIIALLNAGAGVNVQDKNGDTPLHWAARSGTLENVIALLNAGADGSVINNAGQTPADLVDGNEALAGTEAYQLLK